jgi:NAD(P)-dependent dehydrogenase (short-subunit alcohol dehydrogenase family)
MSLHAVITGGGTGIGAATAMALVEQGVQVTLMGRDEPRLQQAADRLNGSALASTGRSDATPIARAVRVDVCDASSVQSAFDAAVAFGAIDILINNAGSAESAPFMRTSLDLWQRMLDVNLSGTFLCTQQVLPGMLERGYGRIVNVASTAALKGYAYVAAYCAAKHGVLGLTRALALEVATRGVTVNAVCPGYTDTDLLAQAIDQIVRKTGRSAEQAKAELAASNPQRRLIRPDEVAQAVAWLCRRESDAINGQAIAVAGGEVM